MSLKPTFISLRSRDNWTGPALRRGLVHHLHCGASANTQSEPPAGTEASRVSPEKSG